MNQTEFSNIVEEQIGEDEFNYSVTAQYQNLNGYFVTLTHFKSNDYDKALEYQKKYDAEFQKFQDSLSEEEVANNDNLDYEHFYNFAVSSLELDYYSENDLIDLQ